MIKKILCLALILSLISFPAFGAWDKAKPAGTDLISDIDTLVVANNTALESTLSGMRGWVNLKVTRASATTVTVTADQLYLQASATLAMRATTVNETIDITASGASGLDEGAEGNKWYYIWIIAKADGTVNGLFSASATDPTLPAGYIYTALVSAVHNTSGDFVNFVDTGDEYFYDEDFQIATGNTSIAATQLDMTAFVPSALSDVCYLKLYGGSESLGTWISPHTFSGVGYGNNLGVIYGEAYENPVVVKIIEANKLYWASNNSVCNITIRGFKKNKI